MAACCYAERGVGKYGMGEKPGRLFIFKESLYEKINRYTIYSPAPGCYTLSAF